jgi:hypothetical protein
MGCAPNGPAKYLRMLGRLWFETFLRSACLEWLCQTPCSHAGYLGVTTLHTLKTNVVLPALSMIVFNHYRRLLHATFLSRSCWVSSDTRHCWFEASSRSARLQGLLEVGPAGLLAAMLGGPGVSTLRSIKTMPLFFFSFWASNQPCFLLQCSGTTLRVRLRCPPVLLVVPTCWETHFSSRHYSTYFLFSLFWIIIPAILPATMLGYYSMSASLMPSEFFHRRFDLLEVCFL